MRKTFKYRAVINKQTEANCRQWLETCQTLYNLALEQRISIYRQHEKSISCYDQIYQLPELKAAYPEFKLIGAQCLQEVLFRLDRAVQAFYRRLKVKQSKAGFPRFKSWHRYDSFTLTQAGWKLEGRYLYIRNVGRFKLFLSRLVEGKIKTVTIKRTPTGKWFVAFSCDNVPDRPLSPTNQSIGIDLGIRNYIVTSRGEVISNPRYFQSSENLLAFKQRRLSRRKKGSNRRNKARLLVAKAHEKIVNQRTDFCFKTALDMVRRYDTIAIESLDIQNMNRFISKQVRDASWGRFLEILHFKAEEAGREVIEISPGETSLICSQCGAVKTKAKRATVYRCDCGLRLDRDHNAAINILRAGQARQGGVGLPASVN